jgi:hypothetical protein
VLAKWEFSDVTYVSGDSGIDEAAARQMPDDLCVVAAGPEGALVAELVGPSLYKGIADGDRYIAQADIHLGSDLKVVSLIEGDEIEITSPPVEDGAAIEADDDYEYPFVRFRAPWRRSPSRWRSCRRPS